MCWLLNSNGQLKGKTRKPTTGRGDATRAGVARGEHGACCGGSPMNCAVRTSHIREDLARKCEDLCASSVDREHLFTSVLAGASEGVS